MGKIAALSAALLRATGVSTAVTAALPLNPQKIAGGLYDTLPSTMKHGRRLGQCGGYARLALAEYIASADRSCLMHQQHCAEKRPTVGCKSIQ
jgi:hypothetical protein